MAISHQLSIGEAFNRQLCSSCSEPVPHLSCLHGVVLGSLCSPAPAIAPNPQLGLLLWLLLLLQGGLLVLGGGGCLILTV